MNLIGMASELIIRPKLIRLKIWEIKQESLSVVHQGLLGAPRVCGGLFVHLSAILNLSIESLQLFSGEHSAKLLC